MGIMEYVAVIPVGRAKMKVNFANGAMTAMGVNPATFTTANQVIQKSIEASKDFKRGFIQKLRVVNLEEEKRDEAKPMQTLTVATLQEARDVLKEKYGIGGRDALTKQSCTEAAKAKGIVLEFR